MSRNSYEDSLEVKIMELEDKLAGIEKEWVERFLAESDALRELLYKEKKISSLMESVLIKLSRIKIHSGFDSDEIYLLSDVCSQVLFEVSVLRSE